jgi:hypothetical protein
MLIQLPCVSTSSFWHYCGLNSERALCSLCLPPLSVSHLWSPLTSSTSKDLLWFQYEQCSPKIHVLVLAPGWLYWQGLGTFWRWGLMGGPWVIRKCAPERNCGSPACPLSASWLVTRALVPTCIPATMCYTHQKPKPLGLSSLELEPPELWAKISLSLLHKCLYQEFCYHNAKLVQGPSPNTVTLGIGASGRALGENVIQSVTGFKIWQHS